MTALEILRRSRLLAIVRSDRAAHAQRIVETLLDVGMEAIEVSLTTPGAIEIIREFAGPSSTTCAVGAGTVLTAEQTVSVAEAGARFIVTPGMSESVDEAVRLGLESFVGVMTPSEAIEAMRRGASAVKLFPAEIGCPTFLRAVRAPLPNYEFIPVGGVTLDLVSEYLDAGAIALGIGSPLTGKASAAPDLALIRKRAADYRAAIQDWSEKQNSEST